MCSVRNGTRFIQEGQVIGVVGGEIISAGADYEEVLEELVAYLWNGQAEMITLYYGAESMWNKPGKPLTVCPVNTGRQQ